MIVCLIMFYNITIENFVDNVIGTLNLFETDSIIDRKNVVYKNSKLNVVYDVGSVETVTSPDHLTTNPPPSSTTTMYSPLYSEDCP